jgi:hypothetical protein
MSTTGFKVITVNIKPSGNHVNHYTASNIAINKPYGSHVNHRVQGHHHTTNRMVNNNPSCRTMSTTGLVSKQPSSISL